MRRIAEVERAREAAGDEDHLFRPNREPHEPRLTAHVAITIGNAMGDHPTPEERAFGVQLGDEEAALAGGSRELTSAEIDGASEHAAEDDVSGGIDADGL